MCSTMQFHFSSAVAAVISSQLWSDCNLASNCVSRHTFQDYAVNGPICPHSTAKYVLVCLNNTLGHLVCYNDVGVACGLLSSATPYSYTADLASADLQDMD